MLERNGEGKLTPALLFLFIALLFVDSAAGVIFPVRNGLDCGANMDLAADLAHV